MKNILRRLRGALGNALVWGAMWFGATFILIGAPVLLHGAFDLFSWDYLRVLSEVSLLSGLVGFVTGGAFSAYVAGGFRGRQIEDLSPWRFALGGALVTVPFVLLIKIWLSAASGDDWIFLSELIRPVAFSATLGAITGFGTVKLAQNALSPGASADELESGSERLLSQT